MTIGTFVIVSITGILLFFHLEIGLVKTMHEWLSWLFVIGGLAHIAINWRAFTKYFSKPASVAIIAVTLAVGAMAFLPVGEGGDGRKAKIMKAVGALEQSPLTLIAQIEKTSPEALLQKLQANGIQVDDASLTIEAIAQSNQKKIDGYFGVTFLENFFRAKQKPLPNSKGFLRQLIFDTEKKLNFCNVLRLRHASFRLTFWQRHGFEPNFLILTQTQSIQTCRQRFCGGQKERLCPQAILAIRMLDFEILKPINQFRTFF
ncbi:DUF4405 domain-containing protein [Chloroherpeton thalassium]|uniref:DUF4405 domain-containing protein n=1 Tax=Chloroherpeton thalassium TaxID=100716 RepID=UPI0034E950C9